MTAGFGEAEMVCLRHLARTLLPSEVPNLYVCDTSVFVTATGVNPTLAAMAIAQRAADRLVEAERRGEL